MNNSNRTELLPLSNVCTTNYTGLTAKDKCEQTINKLCCWVNMQLKTSWEFETNKGMLKILILSKRQGPQKALKEQ